jgi:hypothetical protein
MPLRRHLMPVRSAGYEPEMSDKRERVIRLEESGLNALRGKGESYSGVTIRLVEGDR